MGARDGPALRNAEAVDMSAVMRLLHGLAEYEHLTVTAREDDLAAALFGTSPRLHAALAEMDGVAVGLAVWFYTYGTFAGRPNLYVEDVFVEPAARGRGIGRACFRHMAREAARAGCLRMEWSVLNWNAPARRFYAGLGAETVTDWSVLRLTGDALAALADEAPACGEKSHG